MYNHASADYVCPFCVLIAGLSHPDARSVHTDIVYHDERVTALVSSHQWPNNHGNVLIVPNEHFENLYDLPDGYGADIHRVARRVALAMKVAYGCDGVSTRQHNEPAGSQDVWHYHLHVTPRYRGDGFYTTHKEPMAVSDRAALARRLRDALAGLEEDGILT